MFKNWLFVFILFFTFAIQMVMVEYGGRIVKCYPLTAEQNLICLGVGAIELIVGFVLKFMPLGLF